MFTVLGDKLRYSSHQTNFSVSCECVQSLDDSAAQSLPVPTLCLIHYLIEKKARSVCQTCLSPNSANEERTHASFQYSTLVKLGKWAINSKCGMALRTHEKSGIANTTLAILLPPPLKLMKENSLKSQDSQRSHNLILISILFITEDFSSVDTIIPFCNHTLHIKLCRDLLLYGGRGYETE